MRCATHATHRSDAEIFAAATRALDRNPRASAAVRVHVSDGIVLLTGSGRDAFRTQSSQCRTSRNRDRAAVAGPPPDAHIKTVPLVSGQHADADQAAHIADVVRLAGFWERCWNADAVRMGIFPNLRNSRVKHDSRTNSGDRVGTPIAHRGIMTMTRWTFIRKEQVLTCEIRVDGSQSYDVCVVPHWNVDASVVERYRRPSAAIGRHAEIAWYLGESGWTRVRETSLRQTAA